MYMHPQYNTNTYNNDVAILKLRTAIQQTSTIKYVTLAASGSDPAANSIGRVAGWYVPLSLPSYPAEPHRTRPTNTFLPGATPRIPQSPPSPCARSTSPSSLVPPASPTTSGTTRPRPSLPTWSALETRRVERTRARVTVEARSWTPTPVCRRVLLAGVLGVRLLGSRVCMLGWVA